MQPRPNLSSMGAWWKTFRIRPSSQPSITSLILAASWLHIDRSRTITMMVMTCPLAVGPQRRPAIG
jgi:hypothetical protein